MKFLANLISYLTHPLLLATYLFALLGWLFPAALAPITERSLKGILILIFVTTFVLPAINVYFFKAFGAIRSMEMKTRQERIGPFLMVAALYGVITYLLHSKTGIGWNEPFMRFLLVVDMLVLAAFVVTLVTKASIHGLAAGASVVIMVMLQFLVENGVFFYPMLASMVLAGAVMSARLYLQAHTPREMLAGFGAGVAVAAAAMFYWFG